MKGTVTIKKNLLKMREEILHGIDANRRTGRTTTEREVGDFYDDVDLEKDRQMLHMLGERERIKLNEIESALQRLEEGTYGLCEECGCDINKKRLKVQPVARYCIKCQEELEKIGGADEETLEDKIFYRDVSLNDMGDSEE
jgi:DnaK suppressor protein